MWKKVLVCFVLILILITLRVEGGAMAPSKHLPEKTDVLTQETLFKKIVLPTFRAYPEIAWFANDNVAATNEGSIEASSDRSWTALLVQEKLLPFTNKKYIELERMLHSVVALHLLVSEESEKAYDYWIQAHPKNIVLTRQAFQALQQLARTYAGTPEAFKVLEASLVYSDLGKTPIAKSRAKALGIIQADHDDFMEAIYAAPQATQEKIIPSLAKLDKTVREDLINLHKAVRLHWGHVSQLEGGPGMFLQLETSKAQGIIQAGQLNQAFLIQICDVAARSAHTSPKGLVAFDQPNYEVYQRVLTVISTLLEKGDSETALLALAQAQVKQLGLSSKPAEASEEELVLARMGALLRLHTSEQGKFLREAAQRTLTSQERNLLVEMFGLKTGINIWRRNPTYMPAVLLNLFNSTSDPATQYERALQGILVLAKITQEYQKRGLHDSDTPLCFNDLAGQARSHPEWFDKPFSVDKLDWEHPKNIKFLAEFKPSPVVSSVLGSQTPPMWRGRNKNRFILGGVVAIGGMFILYNLFRSENQNPLTQALLSLDPPKKPFIK